MKEVKEKLAWEPKESNLFWWVEPKELVLWSRNHLNNPDLELELQWPDAAVWDYVPLRPGAACFLPRGWWKTPVSAQETYPVLRSCQLTHFVFITYTVGVNRLSGFPAGLHLQQSISATNVCVNGVPRPQGETTSLCIKHTGTETIVANLPGLMEALVGIMLQQRPGDAVVGRVVQQDALSGLVGCGAGAQGAAAAEAECELQVPSGDKRRQK